jgi:hypothetical protein
MATTTTNSDSTGAPMEIDETKLAPAPVEATTKTTTTSAFQQGIVLMKDANVLDTSRGSLESLATLVQADSLTKGFDAVYANIPWKAVSREYLMALPIKNLMVNSCDTSSLFLWVDSCYADVAVDVLRAWGFAFRSVVHTLTYDNPKIAAPTTKAPTTTKTANETDDEGKTSAEEDGGGVVTTDDEKTDEPPVTKTSGGGGRGRKPIIPPGWSSEGIVPSRVRQLWYAEAVPTVDAALTTTTSSRYLKDDTFVRKRLQSSSTFVYPPSGDDEADPIVTLSVKKKNIQFWRLFPDYDVYLPQSIQLALASIFRPGAKVLSLFSQDLSKVWYTWGPNIPGYFCGPLKNENGFLLPTIVLKYATSMKIALLQKHIGLVNQYAIQLAKSLGAPEDRAASLLIESRLYDFLNDLCSRAEMAGGMREHPLASASTVRLIAPGEFVNLSPDAKTQFLLVLAKVMKVALRRATDVTERRRKAGASRKRKAPDEGGSGSDAGVQQPRQYGIAAPTKISKELADFMGVTQETKVARTAVVKFINEYIAQKALQNPEKKTNINLDDALTRLLRPDSKFGPVTYFNLCKLLGPHFLNVAAT